MARICMQNAANLTVEEAFELFLSTTAAKWVKNKTLETYRNHFKSISKRLTQSLSDKTDFDIIKINWAVM